MGKGGRRYPIEYAEGRELDFASLLMERSGATSLAGTGSSGRVRCNVTWQTGSDQGLKCKNESKGANGH